MGAKMLKSNLLCNLVGVVFFLIWGCFFVFLFAFFRLWCPILHRLLMIPFSLKFCSIYEESFTHRYRAKDPQCSLEDRNLNTVQFKKLLDAVIKSLRCYEMTKEHLYHDRSYVEAALSRDAEPIRNRK